MKDLKWTLLLAVILIGVGWWLALHQLTAQREAWQGWQSHTDSLLGAAGRRHDSVTLQLSERADSFRLAATQEAQSRAQAEARAAQQGQEAQSLHQQLDSARGALDSLGIALQLVGTLERQVASKDSVIRSWTRSYALLDTSHTLLQQRIRVDSGRIVDLTHQLETIPKPPRPKLLLGILPKPTCVAGVSGVGYPKPAAGLGLTCGFPVTR